MIWVWSIRVRISLLNRGIRSFRYPIVSTFRHRYRLLSHNASQNQKHAGAYKRPYEQPWKGSRASHSASPSATWEVRQPLETAISHSGILTRIRNYLRRRTDVRWRLVALHSPQTCSDHLQNDHAFVRNAVIWLQSMKGMMSSFAFGQCGKWQPQSRKYQLFI